MSAIRIDITPTEQVTATIYRADEPAGHKLILAHGAGADQASAFMVRYANALAARGTDTITFNFLYTEQRRRIPDRSDKLEACYRKVIEAVCGGAFGDEVARNHLVIGGKSMGGRIASQVAAADRGLAGLLLLGYPLHPPGQPAKLRTAHLAAIETPLLFIQGSRDTFGTPEELEPHLRGLKASAELYVVAGGDHSFKVLKREGHSQDRTEQMVLDEIVRWLAARAHVANPAAASRHR